MTKKTAPRCLQSPKQPSRRRSAPGATSSSRWCGQKEGPEEEVEEGVDADFSVAVDTVAYIRYDHVD
jgi:hypothetical protein